jgi:NAD(P)-dependent dehydrogenase (short-subunit alcohol dehydrogenase family)
VPVVEDANSSRGAGVLDFEGRVALITGAGSGLGRAHAQLLASRGAAVVVADLPAGGSAASGAALVVESIVANGGEAVVAEGTVADADGGRALVQRALDAYGRLDIVINNAGVVRDRSFAKLDDEALEAVMRVHLFGAFNVTRPAWEHMRAANYGRILNTTSNAGILGNFGQANYAAAKTGLIGLTRVLSIEGRRYGILVNALAPMGKTAMTEGVRWPVFDVLEPELVAPVAAWLVHEACPVTGEVYSAAGGQVSRFFTGLTPGFHSANLTPEDVRDHFAQIRDTDGFVEPPDATAEIELLSQKLGYEEIA